MSITEPSKKYKKSKCGLKSGNFETLRKSR